MKLGYSTAFYRPQAVIHGSVTICESFCLAIRYALVPLPARSSLPSRKDIVWLSYLNL